MIVLSDAELTPCALEGSVVTIGNFDGVHRGHAALFRRLVERSRQTGMPSVAVTFEPHPLAVLAPDAAPRMLSTFAQKHALIAASQIDYLVIIGFTREFSRIPADEFVRNTLCGSLGMRHIIIGHDYAFGRDRLGNYDTLERLGGELGFTLEDMAPVGGDAMVFSSSLARRLIAEGDMPAAADVLGRYHMVAGRVVHGREIGRSLGFPTANIVTDNEVIPPDGIYAVTVLLQGRLVKGACNIGLNPTFDGNVRTIEVFLLDFADQIYDEQISLFFVQRLRDVMKFPDVPSLVDAITRDVAQARMILNEVRDDLIQPRYLCMEP